MDVMILLVLLYIVMCWLWKRNIPDGHGRINMLVLLLSSILVIVGCITPINMVYMFFAAIALLLIDYIIMSVRYRVEK